MSEIKEADLNQYKVPGKGRSLKRAILFTFIAFLGLYILLDIAGIILLWPRGERSLREAKIMEAETDINHLKQVVNLLEKKLDSQKPKGVYILIDSGANRLFLKKGDILLREAIISCGSGSILEEPGGKRRWIFDTPRGEFTVKSKIVDPDWIKPDWAFIEEGKEPPKSWKERVESGVLGDYALGFGNGYFIHGTLYTRLLGRNVTHGCIRVGDEDLEVVFKNAQIGTKIYIY